MIIFSNYDQYTKWAEQFENCSDYEENPVAIDDGWIIATDMVTKCKRWDVALRRFKKTFAEVSPEIKVWVECMKEGCKSGCFQDMTGWCPAHTNDPKKIMEFAKGGRYSWGVEETKEGYWHVFLNISGVYAGREART